jgi:integrase
VSVQEGKGKRQRRSRRKNRCMFRDERGRWWLDYYTPDGKRRRKIAGKTREDAERALRDVRSSVDRGEYVDPRGTPGFSAFCEVYHERYGQHLASHAKSSARINHLKNYFGDRNLAAITPDMIERYRLARLATGKARDGESVVSRATINREIGLLRAILAKSVRWGLLARNPASRVEDYDEGEQRERYLTREEILRLLVATKRSFSPLLRAVVYLALETGMRKREIFDLKWADVDLQGGQILVRKTKTGVQRHVPLSRRARWLLSKRAARDPLAGWVFESRGRDGEPAAVSDVKKAWRAALRRARIEDFRFHDLRHTFASHFAMKGGNIYALAKILGHANPKMTLDRYAHLSQEYIAEQHAVMDRASYRHQMDTSVVSGKR